MSVALTGVRPTGELTIANLVGAMQPMVELQDTFDGPVNIFAADLHGLTDQEPDLVNSTRLDTVRSLLAAGIEPNKTTVYLQSQISEPTIELATYFDRHTTRNELERVPTLKEKIKAGQETGAINLSLLRYPVLMAADICIQDATYVPVGEDQLPHIEFTRKLARRFNNQYGNGEAVLVQPDLLAVESLRIASLDGEGKMSKSRPNGAILLRDTPDAVAQKVKKAQTAAPGEMTDVLESHFTLCAALASTDEERAAFAELRDQHCQGGRIMGSFKTAMTEVITRRLTDYQERYNGITDKEVHDVLVDGGQRAAAKAEDVILRVRSAMGIVAFA
jgi:tryptophanyl-tRNA synthetase